MTYTIWTRFELDRSPRYYVVNRVTLRVESVHGSLVIAKEMMYRLTQGGAASSSF